MNRGSKIYSRLVNEGPFPGSELKGGANEYLRKDGVTTFKVRSSKGSSASGSGNSTDIVYIDGRHKPITVLKTWLEHNEKYVNSLSNWAVHKRIAHMGPEWAEASRELFGPFEHLNGPGTYEAGGECPMCGEEYERYLPDHLPCGEP